MRVHHSLLEEGLRVAFVARTGNLENIREIVSHPAEMIGTDAILTGGRPNPRTYDTHTCWHNSCAEKDCSLWKRPSAR